MRRSKFDIFANILEVLKRNRDGCRITRLAYGIEVPNDRAKQYLEDLIDYGLVRPFTKDHRKYSITKRGSEFLEVYYKMISFFGLLE